MDVGIQETNRQPQDESPSTLMLLSSLYHIVTEAKCSPKQGVYVLTDNSFRPFAKMSTEAGGQAVVRAQPVCLYPFCFNVGNRC